MIEKLKPVHEDDHLCYVMRVDWIKKMNEIICIVNKLDEQLSRLCFDYEQTAKRLRQHVLEEACEMLYKQPEIKPCPFCGEGGEVVDNPKGWFEVSHKENCFMGIGYAKVKTPFNMDKLPSWNRREGR